MFEMEFAIVLISTIGTAVWTVLTWSEQQEKERKVEQEQIDALYINPFLLATEELQSLLYDILVENEIESLRLNISHSDDNGDEITHYEALEVIYVIIKYFGWSWYLYRYSSYTHDKNAIELTRNISETFADRHRFGIDPFRFTFTKQRSLGQIFVRRISTNNANYPEFKAVPLFQFMQEIIDSKKHNEPLYYSIIKTIDAISRSKSINDLEGLARLIEVQNQLVDLLNYIESQEGFSVSSKKRLKTKLVGNKILVEEPTSITANNVLSEWEKIIPWLPSTPSTEELQVIHKTKGRIRLKVPQLLGYKNYAGELQSQIQTITGVESTQVNQEAASIIVYYNDQIPEREFERTLLETINPTGA